MTIAPLPRFELTVQMRSIMVVYNVSRRSPVRSFHPETAAGFKLAASAMMPDSSVNIASTGRPL